MLLVFVIAFKSHTCFIKARKFLSECKTCFKVLADFVLCGKGKEISQLKNCISTGVKMTSDRLSICIFNSKSCINQIIALSTLFIHVHLDVNI